MILILILILIRYYMINDIDIDIDIEIKLIIDDWQMAVAVRRGIIKFNHSSMYASSISSSIMFNNSNRISSVSAPFSVSLTMSHLTFILTISSAP